MSKRREHMERAVARAGRSSLNPADTRLRGFVDLSPEAVEARRRGGGGPTGLELIELAAANLQRANELAQLSGNPSERFARRRRASAQADRALVTAACQIRVAEHCPLGKPYLHGLDLPTIQTIEREVLAVMGQDAGALAVDTHRRIQQQRERRRAEGVTA